MKYEGYREGTFLARPNRFIAKVLVDGQEVTAHVKNTGRCKELLVPGCKVGLSFPTNAAARKTPCDLVQVEKATENGSILINMDSQAPNRLLEEFLHSEKAAEVFSGLLEIRREVQTEDSRLDFCLRDDQGPIWIEVKGCTLEREGRGFFPDAPTVRGTKHLDCLKQKVLDGERAAVVFVAQSSVFKSVSPNSETDPAFTNALKEAVAAGVRPLAFTCLVKEGAVWIDRSIPVLLSL